MYWLESTVVHKGNILSEDINDYFNKKKKLETLNINCPNCDKENTIKLSSSLKCKHCEEPLTKTKYEKLKTPFIGTLTAVIIGSVGGHQITEYFDTDRYPMSIEHSILENCISSYKKPLRTSYIQDKKNVCVCAFSKTIQDYDYSEFKKNQDKFLIIFENKSKECQ